MTKTQKKKEAKRIEKRLRTRMESRRNLKTLCPTLVSWIADWTRHSEYRLEDYDYDNRDKFWNESDFLCWALRGRTKAFVDYCKELNTREARKALEGIQEVYDYKWPHNSIGGYWFYHKWGWLQLELEKPGERRPQSPMEQQELIEKTLKKANIKIKGWTGDAWGGVRAITE